MDMSTPVFLQVNFLIPQNSLKKTFGGRVDFR